MAPVAGTAFTQSLQFFVCFRYDPRVYTEFVKTQLPTGLRHSPHLTRFFVVIPALQLFPLLLQTFQNLGVKTKDKPPTMIVVGGHDARKERFKGRVSIEQFTWRDNECCFVEMAREEVHLSMHRYSCILMLPQGNPLSWRQLWKVVVKSPLVQPHVLRRKS